MGDVIELSSSDEDEEIKGIKRKNLFEEGDNERDEKRLKLSPFKADTIIIDDEDLDLRIVEDGAIIPDVPDKNGAANGKETPKSGTDKTIDLTTTQSQEAKNGGGDEEDKHSSSTKSEARSSKSVQENGEKNEEDEDESLDTPLTEMDERTSEFIDKCLEMVTQVKLKKVFVEKLDVFKKRYLCASKYVTTTAYTDFLERKFEELENGKTTPVTLFNSVYRTLEDNCNVNRISGRLKRLEEMMAKLNKKIKALEEAEVNFDDEENSSYLQLQRYKDRAFKVFAAIKKIEKDDLNRGRPYYGRIDFATSSYPEINNALSKKYQDRDKRPFPTFDGVDKCVRQTVKKHNLKMSEPEIRIEVSKCFTSLGKVLQSKRKLDLASVHYEYLGEVVQDPADKDPELNRKLLENSQTFHTSMDQIITKYVVLQTEGLPKELSSDSDDSNKSNSDDSETDQV